MKPLVSAFVGGALFGVGLVISQMTRPDKVIGFLDFTGDWDPSLAFVMAGAVMVYGIGRRLVRRRVAPVLAPRFLEPTRHDIGPRLLGGAALFGLGWGLAGFCPGPALISVLPGERSALIFTVAMLGGMALFHLMERGLQRRAAALQAS